MLAAVQTSESVYSFENMCEFVQLPEMLQPFSVSTTKKGDQESLSVMQRSGCTFNEQDTRKQGEW